MVGCCHGRPHRWGVRYDARHAEAGLTHALVGVRLFPVQLLEAALALLIVSTGAVLVAAGAAPGAAFTWYVSAYAVARFFLELARGDAERPSLLGFSQPQWLSLACACVVTALAAADAVPWHPWDAAPPVIACAMGVLALRRRSRGAAHVAALAPAHLQEIAAAVAHGAWDRGVPPHVVLTSQGIRVSAGPGHVTLSSADGGMTDALARDLARHAAGALPASGRADVLAGGAGVFHVVMR
jgi:hypothetical protein